MAKILERGDIFFLYRPKLNATSVQGTKGKAQNAGLRSTSTSS
jgi:hypothetical protein